MNQRESIAMVVTFAVATAHWWYLRSRRSGSDSKLSGGTQGAA
jgi:hypothetical protein